MPKLAALAALTCVPLMLSGQGVSIPGPPGATLWTLQGSKTIDFALQADPPLAMMRFQSGSSVHSSNGAAGAEVVAHRYFYNEGDQTYFGYDVQFESDPRTGTARITFYDLSIGVLDVVPHAVRGDAAAWKRLPTPTLPAPREIHTGDSIRIDLWQDTAAGQKLADLIRFDQSVPLRQHVTMTPGTQPALTRFPETRPVPTLPGDAHAYSAEDAELRLAQVRVTVNGELHEAPMRTAAAGGPLVWFHLPKRGRYVLSLASRPELGFVQAGEVRGGSATFTVGNDKFLLESYTSFAPGSAPYFLYVLHDPEWAPTAANQGDALQFGSVNPRELALLQKK